MLQDRITQLLGRYIHLSNPRHYRDLSLYVIDRPWLAVRLLHDDVGAEIVLEADRLNRVAQGMYRES